MKLLAAIREMQNTDARPRGRDTASAEQGQAGGFDDVLAKVGDKTGTSKAKDAGPPSASQTSSRSANVTGQVDPAETDAAVDTLLKRMKGKTDDASDPDQAVPTNAPDPSVAAILLPNVPIAISGGGNANQSAAEAPAAPALPTAEAPGEKAARSQTAIVSNIALETHAAPVVRGTAAPEPDAAQPTSKASDQAVTTESEAGSSEPETKVSPDLSRPVPSGAASRNDTAHGRPDDPSGGGEKRTTASRLATGSPNQADASLQSADAHDRPAEVHASRSADGPAPTTAPALEAQAPIRQVARAVVDLATKASTIAVPTETPAAIPAIARTVTLQMSPANLGTVEIRLHMSGQALDLQLKISERDTLGLVTRERDTLAAALHDQNYALHSLTIQDGSGAAAPGGSHAGNQGSSGEAKPQRGSETFGSSGGGGDQRRGDDPNHPPRGSARSRGEETSRARLADGRSLFI